MRYCENPPVEPSGVRRIADSNGTDGPRATVGRHAYGAYLQPPRLCGFEFPPAGTGETDAAVIDAARTNGTRIHWRCTIDDVEVALTHGGGVFALFPSEPAATDPVKRINAQHQRSVELLNMVVCELALACDVPATAFSVSDIASAGDVRADDRLEIWAATRPYAPQAMHHQADMRSGAETVSAWERTSAEALSNLGELRLARTLYDIAAEIPALVAGAVGHHHRGRPAEATLFAWMVCERLINHAWATEIMPAARSDAHGSQLRDHRTYTAAVRIEILCREGLLDETDFDLLSRARRARNDQAHNRPATHEDALASMQAMFAVLGHVLGDAH
jgi:hypothetical protein